MTRKILSIATLMLFVWFEISCTVHVTKKLTPEEVVEKGKTDKEYAPKVLAVTKHSGDRLEFVGKLPGVIHDSQVVGEYCPADKVIEFEKIKKTKVNRQDHTMLITTWDGRVTSLRNPLRKAQKFYQTPLISDSIPLSEISELLVKQFDKKQSTLSTAIVTILALSSIIVLIVAAADFSAHFMKGFSLPPYPYK